MRNRNVCEIWETFNAEKLEIPTPSEFMLMSDYFDEATEEWLLNMRDTVVAGCTSRRLNIEPLGVSLVFIFTKGLIGIEVPRDWYNFMIMKRSELWPGLYISLMEKR